MPKINNNVDMVTKYIALFFLQILLCNKTDQCIICPRFLTLKASVMTTADNKFCDIFLNFQKKQGQ